MNLNPNFLNTSLCVITNGLELGVIQGPPKNTVSIFPAGSNTPKNLYSFLPSELGEQSEHPLNAGAFDYEGRWIWIVNSKDGQILRIDHLQGEVLSTYGKNEPLFQYPLGIVSLANGNALVCDTVGKHILMIDIQRNVVTSLNTRQFNFISPKFIALNRESKIAYITDLYRIVSLELKTGYCKVLYGRSLEKDNENTIENVKKFGSLTSITLDYSAEQKIVVTDIKHRICLQVSSATGEVGRINLTGSLPPSFAPSYVEIDPMSGNLVLSGHLSTGGRMVQARSPYRGKKQFKQLILLRAIRFGGLTRQASDETHPLHKVRKHVMQILTSNTLSPEELDTVYELSPQLAKNPKRAKICRNLILRESYWKDLNFKRKVLTNFTKAIKVTRAIRKKPIYKKTVHQLVMRTIAADAFKPAQFESVCALAPTFFHGRKLTQEVRNLRDHLLT